MRITADQINRHLEAGGAVQITTYTLSRIYTSKHAGWFTTGKDGSVRVRQGKRLEHLTLGDGTPLVSFRFGAPRGATAACDHCATTHAAASLAEGALGDVCGHCGQGVLRLA